MKILFLISALFFATGFSLPPDTYPLMVKVVFPFEREDGTKMVAAEYATFSIYLNGVEIHGSPFKVKATSPTYQQVMFFKTTEKYNEISLTVTDSDGKKSRMSEKFVRDFR